MREIPYSLDPNSVCNNCENQIKQLATEQGIYNPYYFCLFLDKFNHSIVQDPKGYAAYLAALLIATNELNCPQDFLDQRAS